MSEISSQIPKEVKIDVRYYAYSQTPNGGRIELRGDTDSFESSATIADSIKKVEKLTEVKRRDESWKPGSNKKILDFNITANLTGENDGS